MNLIDFSSTAELFFKIQTLLSSGDVKKVKIAGDLFEQYTRQWHLEFNDYIEIYDANDSASIPQHIIDQIDAQHLLSKGANSTGIDKIAVTCFGEIDVHQDKSSVHQEKNASVQKCSLMMSLRNNGLKNIRNFVLNTTYADLSHYSSIWKDQPPVVFSFGDFCPAELDDDAVAKDLSFWQKIKRSSQRTDLKINSFIARGQEQIDYIATVKSKLIQQLENSGYAKGFAKGAGSLGKSVLDPVLLAEIQNECWKPYLTNSDAPVTVSFYHSSKTINSNGWEEVQRRRAAGIYDEVIVVSGTEIIDQDGDTENVSDKFYKSTNEVDIAVKVIDAINRKQSVLLITLYHHAGVIEEVRRLIAKKIKKFTFWSRKRDECDWPCSNYNSSFAPALDNRTDSVITFGSTGTERWGDPHKDYGTNNLAIHGPLLHSFSWADAENANLVKKLMMITPGVKVSELASYFPEIVDKDGSVDLDLRVKGVPVNNTYPTAEQVLKIACVAKALVLYPQAQRLLMFSNFVKTNSLIQTNWKWVCDKVLGRTLAEKKVKNLYIEVMNDEAYNANSLTNHMSAIKRAKGKGNYIIGSCRLFNRGYDDKPPHGYKGSWLRHNAGFHIDKRSEVNLVQEIWRFTRLDKNDSDPFAYYICPMIYNDLASDGATWSESTVATLTAILKHNRNIKDDFESLIKNPSQRARSQKGTGPFRFWIPADFDPALLNNLITTTAQSSKGIFYASLYIEAHDWLLENYLKLPVLNAKTMAPVSKEWLKTPRFRPLFDTYPVFSTNPLQFREKFWAGDYTIPVEVKKHINENKVEYKLRLQKQKEHEDRLKKIIEDYAEKFLPTMLAPDVRYLGIADWAKNTLGVGDSFAKKVYIPIKNKWFKNKTVYSKNQKLVYRMIVKAGTDANSKDEWVKNTLLLIKQSSISTYGITKETINGFISTDRYKVLSATEFEKIQQMRKDIWLSSTRNANTKNNTGKKRPDHSKTMKGRKRPDQSLRMLGKNNPMFGRSHSTKKSI